MSFYISKNLEKQGAWLLEIHRPMQPKQVNGNIQVALEDLVDLRPTAWTTLLAAKRAAAHHVGRSRLTWIAEGNECFVASLDVKVED